MGAWLLIWPDKAYINTKDLTDFGSLENKRVTEGEVSFALCRPDGTVYSGYLAADEAPEEPEAGSPVAGYPAAMRLPCGSTARTAGRRRTMCACA